MPELSTLMKDIHELEAQIEQDMYGWIRQGINIL